MLSPLDLPEILTLVAHYLSLGDLAACSCVNHTWHQILTPYLWSEVILLDPRQKTHDRYHRGSRNSRNRRYHRRVAIVKNEDIDCRECDLASAVDITRTTSNSRGAVTMAKLGEWSLLSSSNSTLPANWIAPPGPRNNNINHLPTIDGICDHAMWIRALTIGGGSWLYYLYPLTHFTFGVKTEPGLEPGLEPGTRPAAKDTNAEDSRYKDLVFANTVNRVRTLQHRMRRIQALGITGRLYWQGQTWQALCLLAHQNLRTLESVRIWNIRSVPPKFWAALAGQVSNGAVTNNSLHPFKDGECCSGVGGLEYDEDRDGHECDGKDRDLWKLGLGIKRLELRGVMFDQSNSAAFWMICRTLERLELVEVRVYGPDAEGQYFRYQTRNTLSDPDKIIAELEVYLASLSLKTKRSGDGHEVVDKEHDKEKKAGPFPKLKSVRLIKNEGADGVQQLRSFIAPCPRLEKLDWRTDWIPVKPMCALLKRPEIWPRLESIQLQQNNTRLEDKELVQLLEAFETGSFRQQGPQPFALASRHRHLRVFNVPCSNFGLSTFRTLEQGQVFSTLQELDFRKSGAPGPWISQAVQTVLCSCPGLITIRAKNLLVKDVVEDERPWVCLGLKKLGVRIVVKCGKVKKLARPLMTEKGVLLRRERLFVCEQDRQDIQERLWGLKRICPTSVDHYMYQTAY